MSQFSVAISLPKQKLLELFNWTKIQKLKGCYSCVVVVFLVMTFDNTILLMPIFNRKNQFYT